MIEGLQRSVIGYRAQAASRQRAGRRVAGLFHAADNAPLMQPAAAAIACPAGLVSPGRVFGGRDDDDSA